MKFFKDKLYKHINDKFIIFLDKLIFRIGEHRSFEFGASLVYYLILSLFPFLIALLNVVNFTNILSSEQLTQYLNVLPEDIFKIVNGFINELNFSSSGSLFSISVIAGLFAASNGIKYVIKNINLAYGFKNNRNFIIQKLFSLLFTIGFILLIFLLVFTQIFGSIILKNLEKYLPQLPINLDFVAILSTILPVLYMVIVFFLIYRFAPVAPMTSKLNTRLVLPGTIFTTIITIIATKGFSFYVSNFGKYSITYGSLGGIIILLVWLWIMSVVILIGGEINATIYSMKHFKTTNLWPRYESIFKNLLKDYKL